MRSLRLLVPLGPVASRCWWASAALPRGQWAAPGGGSEQPGKAPRPLRPPGQGSLPGPRPFSSSQASSKLPGSNQRELDTGSCAEADGEEEDDDDDGVEFGTLSDKFSSRKYYHKTTSHFQNLKLQEEGEEEGERKPWRGPKNTPYWYFLKCKALIKEDKVCSQLFACLGFNSIATLSCCLKSLQKEVK